MSYIKINDDFCQRFRNLRKKYGATAKEISEKIQKNPSYITKLENGKIQKISIDDLFNIFSTIIDDDNTINNVISDFISNVPIETSKEDNQRSEWELNFDTVFRKIPISIELREFIQSELLRLNKTVEEVVDKANKNTLLSEETREKLKKREPNIWYMYSIFVPKLRYI